MTFSRPRFSSYLIGGIAGLVFASFTSSASAVIVDLTVSIENLAPTNSVSFAPTRVGFHNGAFDPFNIGATAQAAIVSIAEGGGGGDWFPALAVADPNSVSGTVVANGGPAVPAGNVGGLSNVATNTFRIDTNSQGFFTFANMVVPSNDLFLGNDTPLGLFDSNGNLLVTSILQTGANIWDANSEQAIAANAAFLQVGTNSLRVEEGGVVAFDFSELSTYGGLTTASGYVFDSSAIAADTQLFRITLSSTAVAVPEPSTLTAGSFLFGAFVVVRWRKRRQSSIELRSEQFLATSR